MLVQITLENVLTCSFCPEEENRIGADFLDFDRRQGSISHTFIEDTVKLQYSDKTKSQKYVNQYTWVILKQTARHS